jgi:hypothetical protein
VLLRGVGCAGWPTRNAVLAFHIATRLYSALISGGEVFPASLKPNYVHGYLSLFTPQWQVWIPSGFGIKKSAFFLIHGILRFEWSEFLATDPEVKVRFPALPDLLRSNGSGTGPREYN